MKTRTSKTLLFLASMAIVAASVGAASTANAQGSIAYASEYSPMTYYGHVVFFDDWGRPFIVVNDQVIYLQSTMGQYQTFVRHYRAHRARYRAWYQRRGVQLRWKHAKRSKRPIAKPRGHSKWPAAKPRGHSKWPAAKPSGHSKRPSAKPSGHSKRPSAKPSGHTRSPRATPSRSNRSRGRRR